MTVELRPLGVKCNLQCLYCYQNPQRDAGNLLQTYDIEKMKTAIEQSGGKFTLFGGEALLIPDEDLEAIWSWGMKKYGGNGIQTNGTLITDNHIRMFKTYKVHVGISVDGPGELNDTRWVGNLRRTREATAKTHAAIERLCQENVDTSLIVTLHRGNATREKLPIMHNWFRYLEGIGITSARLHILEVENEAVREKYALSVEENIEAFMSFLELSQELTGLQLDTFDDIRKLLLGQDDSVTCVWNACDPYTTRAVRGVEGDGQRSNCGRSNKDGIDFVKADVEGFERYLALYHTPQKYNGCQGCRFFSMCKGQCPGTAIDSDWRNRTEYCQVWKAFFQYFEDSLIADGITPISKHPDRQQIEYALLKSWAEGSYISIQSALGQMHPSQTTISPGQTNSHGDHTDHGDSNQYQHGDSHGDHTDRPGRRRTS